ncbi:vigilin-like [Nematostella vectensis]|uniref:vigilin-like n=1 Tax=Nematostella vectensis TaxID=45351 RepID=UPI002076DF29|nr:vigilin-like [Nematostella vectensis]
MDILNGSASVDPMFPGGSVYSDGGYIPPQEIPTEYQETMVNDDALDTEGYQPTYAEAFPPLPCAPSTDQNQANSNPAAKWRTHGTGHIRSTTVTQVFRVPLEERRYKLFHEATFGDERQHSICRDIMAKTGASIEVSLGKDLSLTIMVTGKPDTVAKARRLVLSQLQTQAQIEIQIPREHHKFILGKGGKTLQTMELSTATKITMPRDGSDTIKIIGTKEGVDRARHEIQLISDQQAKLAFERLAIPKTFHPFISGPNNETANRIKEQTGAAINIPPPSVNKDELTVAGEKDGVAQAKAMILEIYEDKKRKTTTVSIEVRKSQHKYIVGPRGGTIHEILELTGVSVEMPPSDSDSETITLRGEQDKLGVALTQVYEKANSVVFAEVAAPRWLHRFIIGRRGQNIRKVTQDLPKVHVEFSDEKDSITLEGPPEQVESARESLEAFIRELIVSMAFAECNVDQKYHPHIIGKNGANVNRIKTETGTSIIIPSNTEKSNTIRIEGSPQGVEVAKNEIMQMVKKLENEKTRDVLINHRFHRTIIGAKGEKIKEVRDKYPEVQISFPDPSKKTDVVSLRGPREDVDKVHAYLKKLNAELVAANYCIDVPIFKQFHKNVIGRGGTTIKKIREETDTKIELPAEGSDSDVIIITGHKAQVEAAREKILAIQNELANVTQLEVHIPAKFHNSIIGAKGRLIRSVMEDCGGVSIKFPPEGSNSDKVLIRGPKDDVEKAKKQLLELTNEKELGSYTVEIRAKPEHHRFLIGRGGASIRKVRENTGARIVFPAAKDEDKELITIIGKQEAVEAAKDELLKSIKDLDNICEGEVHVDPKWHRHFVAKRGEVLQEIAAEFGGVVVSFPRNGVNSDRVVLKGAKECVEGARQRVMEIVQELESMVTIECVIPQEFHRNIMGAKGANVQEVTARHKVQIKFPDRSPAGEEPVVNGDGEHLDPEAPISPRKRDIIIITGKKESAEAAKIDLLDLVPVTEQMHIPFDYHRFVIGPKGSNVRKMMDEFSVNISIPPAKDESDSVSVIGPRANVERAMKALEAKVAEIEAENEDRALRSFKMDVKVDRQYHPKIIGRKGQVITNIRKQYDVNIQFPPQDAPEESADVIGLTGYQHSCEAARDAILKIVKELEDQVSVELTIDPRIHRRLIGAKGRAVRKLMEQYKVDIRFPRQNANDPVVISGQEQDVEEAKEQLLLLEEEYMQSVKEEIEEYDAISYYMNPPSKTSPSPPPQAGGQGFVVRDAPWNAQGGKGRPPKERDGHPPPPDTTNTMDFPSIGNSVAPKTTVWGHRR